MKSLKESFHDRWRCPKKSSGNAKNYLVTGCSLKNETFTCRLYFCNNVCMHHLRNAKLIARFMLVWFALSIGVAIASPMVKQQGMELVCSGAGAMKVIFAGDDGKMPATGHTLDCLLCAGISAPPPMEILAFSATAPKGFVQPSAGSNFVFFVLAAPPPARGPPALS